MKQIYNIRYFSNYYIYLLFVFPLFLISGPFLPDLYISASLIIFVCLKEIKIYHEKNNSIFLSLIFFYIVIVICSILSEYFLQSFVTSFTFLRFIIFTLVVSFLLKKNNIFDRKILFFYYIILTIVCFDAWIQYLTGKNLLLFQQLVPNRISGFFGSDLILGSFLSKIYPFVTFVYFLNNKNSQKFDQIFFFCFSLLLTITIFITGERAALNHHIIFLIILFFFTIDFSIKKILTLIIFLLISFVMINIDKGVKNRQIFSQYQNIKTKNIFTVYHLQHFKTAYNIFLDNKFFGTGTKTFRFECKKKKYKESYELNRKGIKSCSTHPHNTYLQLLSETGLFSFFIITFIFLFFVWKLFSLFLLRVKGKLEFHHYPLVSIYGFMFFYLFPISTNGNFFNNWLSSIFSLYLGVYFFAKDRKIK